MTDTEFVAAFTSCTLPPEQFPHREHVRLAWLMLREAPLLTALQRFTEGLRRYATSVGAPQRYHETITWAYLLLIHERSQRSLAADFAAFAAENPDLMTWQPSLLARYYRDETLHSELARKVFLFPDRLPLPQAAPGDATAIPAHKNAC